ncbi:MAG TPA: DUF1015 domain-containing protein [Dehalococcoidia bacterium]|nr:DUF1015 domain-containing protein [Dehalococcoidia bacterium]
MADLRPLRGLRYQERIAGDLGAVLAPPYDVISGDTQRALYDRGPYNVVRLEYGVEAEDTGASRYQAAAATLAGWRRKGVLATDPMPGLYLYEQGFQHDGRAYRRRSIIGRVRLEPWEAGVILPHEHTLAGPKRDRLRLLQACRTDVSPVFGLYRPDGGRALSVCEPAATIAPLVDAIDIAGQRHRLWPVEDPHAIEAVARQFASRTLYIADGHHRYETALHYRDEQRSASPAWTGEEPENFVLMALTAADDPGLLILPIHRLVRPVTPQAGLLEALSATFDVLAEGRPEALNASSAQLLERLRAEGSRRPVFGCLGLSEELVLIALRESDAVAKQMPLGHSDAWRRLGVNLLQYGILEPLLGIDIDTVRAGGHVEFTESAEEARAEVRSGGFPLAFLLNATRPEEIFAVADAGDRMPQKSTYFYPKLGTGLVLYAMDA